MSTLAMRLACDNGDAPPSGSGFDLTEHVCRYCHGRVLRSGDQFRCSGCAAVTMGSPEGVCGCGMLATFRAGAATFRCGKNPAQSASSPAEYVIHFGEKPLQAAA